MSAWHLKPACFHLSGLRATSPGHLASTFEAEVLLKFTQQQLIQTLAGRLSLRPDHREALGFDLHCEQKGSRDRGAQVR